MNIVSSFRMKEIDRISIEERGFGGLLLMENAGIRILQAAESAVDFSGKRPVVCAAGSGNNGGDALVIARQIFSLMENPVTIVITKENGTESFEFHLNLCRNLGIRIIKAEDSESETEAYQKIEDAEIIFDGLSGTGVNGPLREPAAALTERINASKAYKLAIDIPSGIGDQFRSGYPAVDADFTFTVGRPKRCMYLPEARPFCGIIHTVRIGFPRDLLNASGCESDGRDWQLVTDSDAEQMMPELSPGDYKNSRGHLAVFAGSPGTSGAASLCAEAALRTSTGLVSLFADSDSYAVLAAKHQAVMVKPAPEGEAAVPDLSRYQAAAAGPGWGVTDRRTAQLKKIIAGSRGVLDADAVTLLAGITAETGNPPDLEGRWVLTPHPGEFRRLFPDFDIAADPYSAVAAAAERLNAVVLLKGITTFIAAADGRSAVVDGCYPRLGTAGSGDVLCGIIGGYAASGVELFDAAVLGAAVHLRAAKLCGEERQWFTADELLNYTGRSF